MIDLQRLDPPPAGFPACTECPYWRTGTPAICFTCANDGTAPATPSVATPAACEFCGQALVDGSCPNTVCHLEDRWFSRIYTVCENPEEMWTAICRFKYDEDKSWAELLGRILVGYLEERREELEDYDLITTCALYVGPEANRLWDHLRLILDVAHREGPSWPFAPDLITKGRPTGRFLGIGVEERRAIAEGELREALAVPDPARVEGKRVLVLDDVYSEGFSMREMALSLRQAGAAEVAGLVFARRKGG